MVGYHYTSEENWVKIREQGLRPYILREDIVEDGIPGIWLYIERQRGLSHAGCILFQIDRRRSLNVVELAIEYDKAITTRSGWHNLPVSHEGTINDGTGRFIAVYHRAAQATIAWRPIAPERIQLLGLYRFGEAWPQTDEIMSIGLFEQSSVEKITP